MQGDKIVVNLGCGSKPHSDAINVDIYMGPGIDQVCDVKEGLPFQDGSIDEIRAEYLLQQIHDGDKFVFVMNEIWRVLKKDGIFKFKVPNAKYPVAFKDPFDQRFFVKETFDYFNIDNRRYEYYKSYGFKPWRILELKEISGPKGHPRDRFSVVMKKP